MFHTPWSGRAILAALTAFASLAVTTFAATPDTRCFELRIYTASPGKLDDLHARFRNHTMRIFAKHGITNIGYFVPVANPEGKLYYFLAYPSREAREESWKEFQADPDWQKAKADSEVNGKLVAAVEQRFFQPTDFSPEVAPAVAADKRVFELRTYQATPKNMERLLQRAHDNTDWLFKAYGVQYLGVWTLMKDQPGSENTLTYLLAHPSAEAGEAAFKQIRADSQWLAIKEASEKAAGGSLTQTQDGIISIPLVATDYSPMK